MSHRTFIIADPHWLHPGVCKFLREDGTKLRPWDSEIEMTEEMIKAHNEIVRPSVDKVYVLGDIVLKGKKQLEVLRRLNGRLCLIMGNHDIYGAKEYLKYFYDVRAYHKLDMMWMSHIPIHPGSLGRVTANIHGHIHSREVLLPDGSVDPRYFCVSAERTNYRPMEWSDVLIQVKQRQKNQDDQNS